MVAVAKDGRRPQCGMQQLVINIVSEDSLSLDVEVVDIATDTYYVDQEKNPRFPFEFEHKSQPPYCRAKHNLKAG
jgi:hypothetical protein